MRLECTRIGFCMRQRHSLEIPTEISMKIADYVGTGLDVLHKCPHCNITNLTKKGLEVHYGKKHKACGKIDWTTVEVTQSGTV